MHGLIKYLREPWLIVIGLNNHGFGKLIPDSIFLKCSFHERMGYKLDLKNPQTFNEKLQWLKLYDRKPIYTLMVDKYAVKQYVAKIIGDEYIIPTIGMWDKFDDIDFASLPNQFVLKCTHDSGGIVICTDKNKLNIQQTKEKINRSLSTNYYLLGRERCYKNVKPRIIAEQYMVDESGYELKDYKFFCFNGKVKCFKIDYDRQISHSANYYDTNMQLLPFGEEVFPPNKSRDIDIPKGINDMILFAERLSQNAPFLRTDFYYVNNKIYFGELTFYPASGFGKFTVDEWDVKLGNMIDLSLV